MIIYNIRNNGPYEYDKFMLNIGQLYNEVSKEKNVFASDSIHRQVKELDEVISYLVSEDSWINKLVLISRKRKRI